MHLPPRVMLVFAVVAMTAIAPATVISLVGSAGDVGAPPPGEIGPDAVSGEERRLPDCPLPARPPASPAQGRVAPLPPAPVPPEWMPLPPATCRGVGDLLSST